MQLAKILRLKYPLIEFMKDVVVQDDGQGPYIKEWNLPDPIPGTPELEQWEKDFDLIDRQQEAVEKRKYPSVGDQLDMLYKDLKSGTTTFVQAIDAIKAAHPKPTE